MNILLTGASGFIGRNIAAVLAREGHTVTPISRRHGVDISKLGHATDWISRVQGMDAVINAVGIIGETRTQRFDALHSLAPQALFDACAQAGVSRVIQISALGADAGAVSHYHRSKRLADDHLRGLDLNWFVLRPSLVYGRGGTSNALFMQLARLPVIPVIGSGRQIVQPLHVADVAATVLACLGSAQSRQTLDLAGNEPVAYAEWLQQLRLAQGRTPAPLFHVPVWMALAGATLGQPFSPMLRPQNIRMLLTPYHADCAPWHALLGRMALNFTPSLLHADAIGALEMTDMKTIKI